MNWNINDSKVFVIFLLAFAGFFAKCNPEKTPDNPNVIFILADDLGWPQTGAYGSTWYETPNIDKLAGQGVSFSQAYSSAAVCSPTRASIMTGKYPARLGLTDFIKGNDRKDCLLNQPEWQKFLPLEEYTLGELFKDHGYATACFGKWHLSIDKKPPASLPYNPDKQGFDEYLVTYKPDGGTDPEGDPHNTDTIVNLSLDFMERKKNEPFFLFVSFNAIHDPLMESKENITHFDEKPGEHLNENNATIGAILKRMDTGIGKIIEKIDELGLEDKSLVVFYSDNGGKESYATQQPFRKGKGWLYEGGIRIPLIVRWPGKIDKAWLSDEKVISNDFFATLSYMLGDSSHNQTDGVDLMPHMRNKSPIEERDLYWHYPHYHLGSGMKPASAIRSGDYKLILWYEESMMGMNEAIEMYDLKADPGETENLREVYPALADSLLLKLMKFLDDSNAGIPTKNEFR
jgi:uncharacterized sulfatase